MGQYGHRKTGCVAGMLVRPTGTNMNNDPRWAQAIQWAIGEFPFWQIPIFLVKIVAADDTDFETRKPNLPTQNTQHGYIQTYHHPVPDSRNQESQMGVDSEMQHNWVQAGATKTFKRSQISLPNGKHCPKTAKNSSPFMRDTAVRAVAPQCLDGS